MYTLLEHPHQHIKKLFLNMTISSFFGSTAENMDDFFAAARKSLRVYLRKKVGPVFRSSEKVKKDLSEADLAELIGSWLEVGFVCFQFLKSHLTAKHRNLHFVFFKLPPVFVERFEN